MAFSLNVDYTKLPFKSYPTSRCWKRLSIKQAGLLDDILLGDALVALDKAVNLTFSDGIFMVATGDVVVTTLVAAKVAAIPPILLAIFTTLRAARVVVVVIGFVGYIVRKSHLVVVAEST